LPKHEEEPDMSTAAFDKHLDDGPSIPDTLPALSTIQVKVTQDSHGAEHIPHSLCNYILTMAALHYSHLPTHD